jgi:hypothetical protein
MEHRASPRPCIHSFLTVYTAVGIMARILYAVKILTLLSCTSRDREVSEVTERLIPRSSSWYLTQQLNCRNRRRLS